MPPNKSHGSGWDTIWVPADHDNLCQTHCKHVPDFSRAQGHMVRFGFTQVNQKSIQLASSRSYLRVYMGCALAIVFQVRSLYIPS